MLTGTRLHIPKWQDCFYQFVPSMAPEKMCRSILLQHDQNMRTCFLLALLIDWCSFLPWNWEVISTLPRIGKEMIEGVNHLSEYDSFYKMKNCVSQYGYSMTRISENMFLIGFVD